MPTDMSKGKKHTPEQIVALGRKKLKALRDARLRLKRLVADQALNIQVLKEVNFKKG